MLRNARVDLRMAEILLSELLDIAVGMDQPHHDANIGGDVDLVEIRAGESKLDDG